MLCIGIDLAWGDKKADGICLIEVSRTSARVVKYAYPRGDDELIITLRPFIEDADELLLTIDAPIVCPNRKGTCPVDRLTHTMFHREHAACHPANSTKCARPPRIVRRLRRLGVDVGWKLEMRPKSGATKTCLPPACR